MNNLVYQICPNLHLKDNQVISYSTVVAYIEGDTLYAKGKYSRTTSKHLLIVMRHLGLRFEYAKHNPEKFYKYECGHKTKIENSISRKVSIALLSRPKEESVLEALCKIEKISRSDWSIIRKSLGLPHDCKPPCSSQMKWESIKSPRRGPRARTGIS